MKMTRRSMIGFLAGAAVVPASAIAAPQTGGLLKHPNCLIVAPTLSGKGVGFIEASKLLTWQGSAVMLDVKGGN